MTIDWTFNGTWPYEPKWFESADGRMHYIDEGEGPPVVMVHGNPTWGYLYRNFVGPVVEAGHRVIVPDLLGFGRSDKPDRTEAYEIGAHADRLAALLDSLDLDRVTMVVQDWGGPIGLYWAARNPERVRGLFVLNTFAHRPRDTVKLPFALKLFRARGVGEVMVKGLHAFVRGGVFRMGVKKRDRITPIVKAAYLAPHPNWASRTSVLVFPREIPSGPEGRVSDLMAEIEAGLVEHFGDKPVSIAWPMQDFAFTPDMIRMWLDILPQAEVTEVDGASHYIQEDAHEIVVPKLVEFLGR
jgi:haloalkane dehalogenase